MGKAFTIVKPSLCCKSTKTLGRTAVSRGIITAWSTCLGCNNVALARLVIYQRGNRLYAVEESRVVWLPDDKQTVENLKELEHET